MLKRIQRGFEFSEDNFALDDIKDTGPGGMFIDKPRTYELMKETMLLSDISDRNPRNRWEKLGAHDSEWQATKKVREILTRDHASLLAPDADARVRAIFPDLPKGDCAAPEAWRKAEEKVAA